MKVYNSSNKKQGIFLITFSLLLIFVIIGLIFFRNNKVSKQDFVVPDHQIVITKNVVNEHKTNIVKQEIVKPYFASSFDKDSWHRDRVIGIVRRSNCWKNISCDSVCSKKIVLGGEVGNNVYSAFIEKQVMDYNKVLSESSFYLEVNVSSDEVVFCG